MQKKGVDFYHIKDWNITGYSITKSLGLWRIDSFQEGGETQMTKKKSGR